MKKTYTTEREGQLAFFEAFGINYTENAVLVDNTDGVWNGNLFEFKLNINNLNKVLSQAIKYLSKMRIKGESVPATILLVDLNNTTVYQYKSQDYFDDIHKVYYGAASVNNDTFEGQKPINKFDYSDAVQVQKLKDVLKEKNFMKIKIDESCILGWAERFYREYPTASKGDFIGDASGLINIKGEIRDPKHFKEFILPYTAGDNDKFKYLMDKLNDKLHQKELGAFYTPSPYCKKALELVRAQIAKIPQGKDYIILDRCAGTGNLERYLTDEEKSHCILSTYEYYEYRILCRDFGDKVRAIIPPAEIEGVLDYSEGLILNADAMSEQYVNNEYIKGFLNDPNVVIIMLENVPYHDESAGLSGGDGERKGKSTSYVLDEMKKEVKGVASNELAHRFIWSAFKYYLRPNGLDSYILFSPCKYWKQYDFANNNYINGFIFNRKYFHATPSAILCAAWTKAAIPSAVSQITAHAYDIDANEDVVYIKDVIIKKAKNPASKLYSNVTFTESDMTSLTCDKNGDENVTHTARVKSYITDDIIGYLEADSFSIAALNRNLVRLCLYNGHGCYLTKSDYINRLPLWCSKLIPLNNWYEMDVYSTTSDGGDKYMKDKAFLKSCLLYTCLSYTNKSRAFTANNGNFYQNELCFDTKALAWKDFNEIVKTCKLTAEEQDLLKTWNKILDEAKKTRNYDPKKNYGVFQIDKDLNTYEREQHGKSWKNVYDYPELNGDLELLRVKLREYYKSTITPKMFQYELVK